MARELRYIKYNGTSKILKRICASLNYMMDHTSEAYMQKAVYDTNDNGIVDNSEKVNGFNVYKDVPADAQFTDTVYDPTLIELRVNTLMNNVQLIMDTIFAPEYSWLLDSQGNVILDSDGYPIYTVKQDDRIAKIQEAITELQGRPYLYYGEKKED